MPVGRVLLASLAAAVALGAVACGSDAPEADRTVELDMVDIAFEPTMVEVATGETVRFVFHNHGQQAHDAVAGDHDEQVALEAEIRGGAGYEYYDDEDAVLVEPGDTGELVTTFEQPGTYELGCHRPGHYDSGMIVTVQVG